MKLRCLVCDKPLENIMDDGVQPNDGLAFISHGHYGTTVFDPMDGTFLEICICDECLQMARSKGVVFHGTRISPTPTALIEVWGEEVFRQPERKAG